MPHASDRGRPEPVAHDDVLRRFGTSPVLSSDRLVMRTIQHDEVPHVRDLTFYEGRAATSDGAARAMLRKIERDQRAGHCVHWAIEQRDVGEIVGTCGFYRGFPSNAGEIGYVLREEHRGKGVMTEAASLVVAFGFEVMKLDSIVAYTDPANAASIAVLARLGFTRVSEAPDRLSFALRPQK